MAKDFDSFWKRVDSYNNHGKHLPNWEDEDDEQEIYANIKQGNYSASSLRDIGVNPETIIDSQVSRARRNSKKLDAAIDEQRSAWRESQREEAQQMINDLTGFSSENRIRDYDDLSSQLSKAQKNLDDISSELDDGFGIVTNRRRINAEEKVKSLQQQMDERFGDYTEEEKEYDRLTNQLTLAQNRLDQIIAEDGTAYSKRRINAENRVNSLRTERDNLFRPKTNLEAWKEAEAGTESGMISFNRDQRKYGSVDNFTAQAYDDDYVARQLQQSASFREKLKNSDKNAIPAGYEFDPVVGAYHNQTTDQWYYPNKGKQDDQKILDTLNARDSELMANSRVAKALEMAGVPYNEETIGYYFKYYGKSDEERQQAAADIQKEIDLNNQASEYASAPKWQLQRENDKLQKELNFLNNQKISSALNRYEAENRAMSDVRNAASDLRTAQYNLAAYIAKTGQFSGAEYDRYQKAVTDAESDYNQKTRRWLDDYAVVQKARNERRSYQEVLDEAQKWDDRADAIAQMNYGNTPGLYTTDYYQAKRNAELLRSVADTFATDEELKDIKKQGKEFVSGWEIMSMNQMPSAYNSETVESRVATANAQNDRVDAAGRELVRRDREGFDNRIAITAAYLATGTGDYDKKDVDLLNAYNDYCQVLNNNALLGLGKHRTNDKNQKYDDGAAGVKRDFKNALKAVGYSDLECENILASVKREINDINTTDMREALAKASKSELGGLMTIASFATQVFSGFGVGAVIEAAFDKSDYTDIDLNSMWLMARNATTAIRQTRMEAKDVKVNLFGESVDLYDFGYGIFTSAVDSMVAGYLGGAIGGALGASAEAAGTIGGIASGVIIGSSAGVETMVDITERGGDWGTALAGGIIAGIFESLFESFSISQFNALRESADLRTLRAIAGNVGKSMLTNFSEEAATEFANIAYDVIINGDFSDFAQLRDQYINDYMANIADPYEDESISRQKAEAYARKQVAKDYALQIGEAGFSGAIQGAGMSMVGMINHYVRVNFQTNQIGKLFVEGKVKEMTTPELEQYMRKVGTKWRTLYSLLSEQRKANVLTADQAVALALAEKSYENAMLELSDRRVEATIDKKGYLASSGSRVESGTIQYKEADGTVLQEQYYRGNSFTGNVDGKKGDTVASGFGIAYDEFGNYRIGNWQNGELKSGIIVAADGVCRVVTQQDGHTHMSDAKRLTEIDTISAEGWDPDNQLFHVTLGENNTKSLSELIHDGEVSVRNLHQVAMEAMHDADKLRNAAPAAEKKPRKRLGFRNAQAYRGNVQAQNQTEAQAETMPSGEEAPDAQEEPTNGFDKAVVMRQLQQTDTRLCGQYLANLVHDGKLTVDQAVDLFVEATRKALVKETIRTDITNALKAIGDDAANAAIAEASKANGTPAEAAPIEAAPTEQAPAATPQTDDGGYMDALVGSEPPAQNQAPKAEEAPKTEAVEEAPKAAENIVESDEGTPAAPVEKVNEEPAAPVAEEAPAESVPAEEEAPKPEAPAVEEPTQPSAVSESAAPGKMIYEQPGSRTFDVVDVDSFEEQEPAPAEPKAERKGFTGIDGTTYNADQADALAAIPDNVLKKALILVSHAAETKTYHYWPSLFGWTKDSAEWQALDKAGLILDGEVDSVALNNESFRRGNLVAKTPAAEIQAIMRGEVVSEPAVTNDAQPKADPESGVVPDAVPVQEMKQKSDAEKLDDVKQKATEPQPVTVTQQKDVKQRAQKAIDSVEQAEKRTNKSAETRKLANEYKKMGKRAMSAIKADVAAGVISVDQAVAVWSSISGIIDKQARNSYREAMTRVAMQNGIKSTDQTYATSEEDRSAEIEAERININNLARELRAAENRYEAIQNDPNYSNDEKIETFARIQALRADLAESVTDMVSETPPKGDYTNVDVEATIAKTESQIKLLSKSLEKLTEGTSEHTGVLNQIAALGDYIEELKTFGNLEWRETKAADGYAVWKPYVDLKENDNGAQEKQQSKPVRGRGTGRVRRREERRSDSSLNRGNAASGGSGGNAAEQSRGHQGVEGASSPAQSRVASDQRKSDELEAIRLLFARQNWRQAAADYDDGRRTMQWKRLGKLTTAKNGKTTFRPNQGDSKTNVELVQWHGEAGLNPALIHVFGADYTASGTQDAAYEFVDKLAFASDDADSFAEMLAKGVKRELIQSIQADRAKGVVYLVVADSVANKIGTRNMTMTFNGQGLSAIILRESTLTSANASSIVDHERGHYVLHISESFANYVVAHANDMFVATSFAGMISGASEAKIQKLEADQKAIRKAASDTSDPARIAELEKQYDQINRDLQRAELALKIKRKISRKFPGQKISEVLAERVVVSDRNGARHLRNTVEVLDYCALHANCVDKNGKQIRIRSMDDYSTLNMKNKASIISEFYNMAMSGNDVSNLIFRLAFADYDEMDTAYEDAYFNLEEEMQKNWDALDAQKDMPEKKDALARAIQAEREAAMRRLQADYDDASVRQATADQVIGMLNMINSDQWKKAADPEVEEYTTVGPDGKRTTDTDRYKVYQQIRELAKEPNNLPIIQAMLKKYGQRMNDNGDIVFDPEVLKLLEKGKEPFDPALSELKRQAKILEQVGLDLTFKDVADWAKRNGRENELLNAYGIKYMSGVHPYANFAIPESVIPFFGQQLTQDPLNHHNATTAIQLTLYAAANTVFDQFRVDADGKYRGTSYYSRARSELMTNAYALAEQRAYASIRDAIESGKSLRIWEFDDPDEVAKLLKQNTPEAKEKLTHMTGSVKDTHIGGTYDISISRVIMAQLFDMLAPEAAVATSAIGSEGFLDVNNDIDLPMKIVSEMNSVRIGTMDDIKEVLAEIIRNGEEGDEAAMEALGIEDPDDLDDIGLENLTLDESDHAKFTKALNVVYQKLHGDSGDINFSEIVPRESKSKNFVGHGPTEVEAIRRVMPESTQYAYEPVTGTLNVEELYGENASMSVDNPDRIRSVAESYDTSDANRLNLPKLTADDLSDFFNSKPTSIDDILNLYWEHGRKVKTNRGSANNYNADIRKAVLIELFNSMRQKEDYSLGLTERDAALEFVNGKLESFIQTRGFMNFNDDFARINVIPLSVFKAMEQIEKISDFAATDLIEQTMRSLDGLELTDITPEMFLGIGASNMDQAQAAWSAYQNFDNVDTAYEDAAKALEEYMNQHPETKGWLFAAETVDDTFNKLRKAEISSRTKKNNTYKAFYDALNWTENYRHSIYMDQLISGDTPVNVNHMSPEDEYYQSTVDAINELDTNIQNRLKDIEKLNKRLIQTESKLKSLEKFTDQFGSEGSEDRLAALRTEYDKIVSDIAQQNKRIENNRNKFKVFQKSIQTQLYATLSQYMQSVNDADFNPRRFVEARPIICADGSINFYTPKNVSWASKFDTRRVSNNAVEGLTMYPHDLLANHPWYLRQGDAMFWEDPLVVKLLKQMAQIDESSEIPDNVKHQYAQAVRDAVGDFLAKAHETDLLYHAPGTYASALYYDNRGSEDTRDIPRSIQSMSAGDTVTLRIDGKTEDNVDRVRIYNKAGDLLGEIHKSDISRPYYITALQHGNDVKATLANFEWRDDAKWPLKFSLNIEIGENKDYQFMINGTDGNPYLGKQYSDLINLDLNQLAMIPGILNKLANDGHDIENLHWWSVAKTNRFTLATLAWWSKYRSKVDLEYGKDFRFEKLSRYETDEFGHPVMHFGKQSYLSDDDFSNMLLDLGIIKPIEQVTIDSLNKMRRYASIHYADMFRWNEDIWVPGNYGTVSAKITDIIEDTDTKEFGSIYDLIPGLDEFRVVLGTVRNSRFAEDFDVNVKDKQIVINKNDSWDARHEALLAAIQLLGASQVVNDKGEFKFNLYDLFDPVNAAKGRFNSLKKQGVNGNDVPTSEKLASALDKHVLRVLKNYNGPNKVIAKMKYELGIGNVTNPAPVTPTEFLMNAPGSDLTILYTMQTDKKKLLFGVDDNGRSLLKRELDEYISSLPASGDIPGVVQIRTPASDYQAAFKLGTQYGFNVSRDPVEGSKRLISNLANYLLSDDLALSMDAYGMKLTDVLDMIEGQTESNLLPYDVFVKLFYGESIPDLKVWTNDWGASDAAALKEWKQKKYEWDRSKEAKLEYDGKKYSKVAVEGKSDVIVTEEFPIPMPDQTTPGARFRNLWRLYNENGRVGPAPTSRIQVAVSGTADEQFCRAILLTMHPQFVYRDANGSRDLIAHYVRDGAWSALASIFRQQFSDLQYYQTTYQSYNTMSLDDMKEQFGADPDPYKVYEDAYYTRGIGITDRYETAGRRINDVITSIAALNNVDLSSLDDDAYAKAYNQYRDYVMNELRELANTTAQTTKAYTENRTKPASEVDPVTKLKAKFNRLPYERIVSIMERVYGSTVNAQAIAKIYSRANDEFARILDENDKIIARLKKIGSNIPIPRLAETIESMEASQQANRTLLSNRNKGDADLMTGKHFFMIEDPVGYMKLAKSAYVNEEEFLTRVLTAMKKELDFMHDVAENATGDFSKQANARYSEMRDTFQTAKENVDKYLASQPATEINAAEEERQQLIKDFNDDQAGVKSILEGNAVMNTDVTDTISRFSRLVEEAAKMLGLNASDYSVLDLINSMNKGTDTKYHTVFAGTPYYTDMLSLAQKYEVDSNINSIIELSKAAQTGNYKAIAAMETTARNVAVDVLGRAYNLGDPGANSMLDEFEYLFTHDLADANAEADLLQRYFALPDDARFAIAAYNYARVASPATAAVQNGQMDLNNATPKEKKQKTGFAKMISLVVNGGTYTTLGADGQNNIAVALPDHRFDLLLDLPQDVVFALFNGEMLGFQFDSDEKADLIDRLAEKFETIGNSAEFELSIFDMLRSFITKYNLDSVEDYNKFFSTFTVDGKKYNLNEIANLLLNDVGTHVDETISLEDLNDDVDIEEDTFVMPVGGFAPMFQNWDYSSRTIMPMGPAARQALMTLYWSFLQPGTDLVENGKYEDAYEKWDIDFIKSVALSQLEQFRDSSARTFDKEDDELASFIISRKIDFADRLYEPLAKTLNEKLDELGKITNKKGNEVDQLERQDRKESQSAGAGNRQNVRSVVEAKDIITAVHIYNECLSLAFASSDNDHIFGDYNTGYLRIAERAKDWLKKYALNTTIAIQIAENDLQVTPDYYVALLKQKIPGLVDNSDLKDSHELFRQFQRAINIYDKCKKSGDLTEFKELFKTYQKRGLSADDYAAFEHAADRGFTDEFKVLTDKIIHLGVTEEMFVDLRNAIGKADYDGAETAYKRIVNQAAKTLQASYSMPTKAINELRAWRYSAMLSQLTTHANNIASTIYNTIKMSEADAFQLFMENAAVKRGTLDDAHRTVARVNIKQDRELFEAASESYAAAQKLIYSNSRIGGMLADITQRSSSWIGSRNPLMKLLELEDNFMGYEIYRQVFAGILKARGITADQYRNMSSVERAEIESVAIDKTQVTLFRNMSLLSQVLTAASQTIVGKVILQPILPFAKIAGNLATQAIEMSPLGFIGAALYSGAEALNRRYIENGSVPSGNKFMDAFYGAAEKIIKSQGETDAMKRKTSNMARWSKALSGLVGVLLGMLGRAIGRITGGEEDDEDKRNLMKLQGYQAFSIRLGDKYYSLSRFFPAGFSMMAGAAVMDTIIRGDMHFGSIFTDTFTDQTFFGDIMNAIGRYAQSISNAKEYGGRQALLSVALTHLQNYANQMIPGMMKTIKNVFVKEYKDRFFYDKDSKLPFAVQYFISNAVDALPFNVEYNRINSRDMLNQTIKTENFGEYMLRVFMGTHTTINEKPYYDWLNKLANETYIDEDGNEKTFANLVIFSEYNNGSPYFSVEGKRLNAEELELYEDILAESLEDIYKALDTNDLFQNSNDNQFKAELINQMEKDVTAKARAAVSAARGVESGEEFKGDAYIGEGTINLNKDDPVLDHDGNWTDTYVYTVRDGTRWVNIPAIIEKDGKRVLVNEDEALQAFQRTGDHLGRFDSRNDAEGAALALTLRQEKHFNMNRTELSKMIANPYANADYRMLDIATKYLTNDTAEPDFNTIEQLLSKWDRYDPVVKSAMLKKSGFDDLLAAYQSDKIDIKTYTDIDKHYRSGDLDDLSAYLLGRGEDAKPSNSALAYYGEQKGKAFTNLLEAAQKGYNLNQYSDLDKANKALFNDGATKEEIENYDKLKARALTQGQHALLDLVSVTNVSKNLVKANDDGYSTTTFFKIKDIYDDLSDDKSLTANQRHDHFNTELKQMFRDEKDVNYFMDMFKYYNNIPIDETVKDKFYSNWKFTDKAAQVVAEKFSALEPINGHKAVRDCQRVIALANAYDKGELNDLGWDVSEWQDFMMRYMKSIYGKNFDKKFGNSYKQALDYYRAQYLKTA